jgi:hypothetical protein
MGQVKFTRVADRIRECVRGTWGKLGDKTKQIVKQYDIFENMETEAWLE